MSDTFQPADWKVSRYAISTRFCGTSARWQTYTSFDGFVNKRLQIKYYKKKQIKQMNGLCI